MFKRIIKKLLKSEKLIDVILTVIWAALDREFTSEEKADVKQKAIDAVMDLLT